jgi:tetratricopeptide (TPR) repeat protein
MLSKEVMVSAPLLAIVYDRIFLASSWRAVFRKRGGLYLALAALWGVYPLLGMSELTSSSSTLGFGFEKMTTGAYLLHQPAVLLHYLRLVFWPHPLVFDYGSGIIPGLGPVVPCTVVLVLLLTATGWALWRRPAAGFLGLAFFFILAPTSSVVPLPDLCVEHRMYLPLAAVLTLVVVGGYAGWQRLGWPQTTGAGVAALALLLGLATVLGATTWQRNHAYHSALTLWQDTVAKRPHSARAQSNLAQALIDVDAPAQALPHAQDALRLQPDYFEARYNLGMALHGLGQYPQAVEQFTRTLQLAPRYAMAHNGLGLCLEALGQPAQAVEHYRQALSLDPTCATAHYNWGITLAAQGRPAEASDHYRQALALRPDYAKAHENLGNALTALGQLPQALEQLEQALRLRPDDADVYYNVGNTLSAMGQPAEALPYFDQALQLDPGHIGAHNNLGAALATLGRLVEAIPHFEVVARAQPGSPLAQRNLGLALLRTQRYDQAAAHLQAALDLARNQGQVQLTRDIAAQLSSCRDGIDQRTPTATAAVPLP